MKLSPAKRSKTAVIIYIQVFRIWLTSVSLTLVTVESTTVGIKFVNNTRSHPRLFLVVWINDSVSSAAGTKFISHNSPQLHPSATMESNWVKPKNLIASFDNQPATYIGKPNVYLECSSYSTMTNFGGSNHFRGFECEQSLATTNINRSFSLLSSLSQQTRVTMQPVPCGLDYYAFVQEMDIKYALCDSNGLEGVFHEDQE